MASQIEQQQTLFDKTNIVQQNRWGDFYMGLLRRICLALSIIIMICAFTGCQETKNTYDHEICTRCRGTGQVYDAGWKKCPRCSGSGYTLKSTGSTIVSSGLDGFDAVIIIGALIGFVFLAIGGCAVALPEGSKASKPFKKFCSKFFPAWILSLVFALWLHGSQIIGTGFAIWVYMACLFIGFGVICWLGSKAQAKS